MVSCSISCGGSLAMLIADAAAVWADHGDIISKAYAGTGALKSDYTRTGKRTREGLLQDGVNGAVRYIRNNFFDGDRQVSWLLCGVHALLEHVADRAGCVRHSDRRLGRQEGRHPSFDRHQAIDHALSEPFRLQRRVKRLTRCRCPTSLALR